LTDKLEFRIADVCDLPFEDGRFDVVIFESVLTPLPGDEKQAMREMVRVVRSGGRVGANEGIVDPEISQEGLALLAEHPAFHGTFTVETLRDLFEASGLETVEAREMQSADLPRPRINLRNLLSFLFQVYPKLLLRLVRDPQIREAQRIDSQLMKGNKEYLRYALLVGRKP
jgi:SAM-dependent methyltransferase